MIDYDKIREQQTSGFAPESWRSLEELADTPEFQQKLKQEFPSQEDKWIDPVTRRNFLKVMGASMALTGLAGCTGFTKPREKILPYTNQPEEMVLGKPLYFATSMPYMGYGYPVLVESHEGRPTKIEGNPEHPDSLGGALAHVQASVLDLYDPDRAQMASYLQEPRDWTEFVAELTLRLSELEGGGEGLALITETVTSPTLASILDNLQKAYPKLRWVQYDPAGRDNIREGAKLAFGDYVDTHYDFKKADVIVTLDSDFMVEGPGAVRYAKAFSARRKAKTADTKINRMYAVEAMPTNTGTLADHKLQLKPSQIEAFARVLASEFGVSGSQADSNAGLKGHEKFLATVVADLKAAKGHGVVVPGENATPTVHALAHALNGAIGAVGSTVSYSDPVEVKPTNQLADLKKLVADMNSGKVKILVMTGVNPVYSSPADLKFEEALLNVNWRASHNTHHDETANLCQWHIPAPHYLESWGDVRSSDGTVSIVQPLIAPLYNSVSVHDLIQQLMGESGKTSYQLVQDYWTKKLTGEGLDFEKAWRRSVHDGLIVNTSAKSRKVTAKTDASAFPTSKHSGGEMEIALRPDPTVHDGRFANNAWLQELPKPFSKVTWDNAVYMSLSTAHKLGVKSEDVVELEANGVKLQGPVSIVMGHASNCVTVHLGYGRTRSGRVAMDHDDGFFVPHGSQAGIRKTVGHVPRGMNAYKIWNSASPRIGSAVKVSKVADKTYKLSCTQLHFSMDHNGMDPAGQIPLVGKLFDGIAHGETTQNAARGLVRRGTIQDFRKFEAGRKSESAEHEKELETDVPLGETSADEDHTTPTYAGSLWAGHVEAEKTDFYEGAWDYSKGYGWGMTIDQSVCNGCNACVTACQAENNIPVVGKIDVRNQREMHWIRIDQYYSGPIDSPTITNQPIPCMHCETAPCEVVCPVAATTHSPEGVNEMVYNRCVGTRFCSNNCPYKVRRFNWFFFTENVYESPLAAMVSNPDVTVRSRGVMEKCTYCIQRINSARIEAENEDRQIRDGDIVTACEATCPTDAIVFGNVNDPNSRVSKLKAGTLNYSLLSDLNTKPRTTYLAVINNPNTEIEEA